VVKLLLTIVFRDFFHVLVIKRMNNLSKWEIKEKNLYNIIYKNDSSFSEMNDSIEEIKKEEKKVSFKTTNEDFHFDILRTKLSPHLV